MKNQKLKNQELFWVMTVCVSAILMTGSAATAAALFIDFDSPTYSLGGLDTQDGWSGSSGYTIIDGANAYSGQSTDTATGANHHITHSAGASYSSGFAAVDFKYFYYTGTSGCMTLRDGATRFLTFGALGTNWYAHSSAGGGAQVAGGGGSPRWLDMRMVLDLNNDTADLQWKELTSSTYTTAFDDHAITAGTTFDGVELDSEKAAMRIDELAIDAVQPLSIDFDSPTYSLGNLDGQDGWVGSSGYQIIDGANAYSGQSTDTATGANHHITHATNLSYSTGQAVVDFKYFYYTGTSGCMTLRDGTTRFLTFGALGTNWYAHSSAGGGAQVAGGGGSPRWLDMRMVLDLDNDTADLQWKELTSSTYTTAFDDHAITAGTTFDGMELDSEKVAMRIDELVVTPEPVTLALLTAGGLLMVVRKRRG